MPGKVSLKIVEGQMQGREFVFDEHDTFLFGRMPECHAHLADDPEVSRHQFVLEVNPPDARIRDLGSLNGTHVNNVKRGGRDRGETPEEGAQRKFPEVDLRDGDKIRVGKTVFAVKIEVRAVCCQCGRSIADKDRERCAWIGGTFICTPCKDKLAASAQPAKAPEPVRCKKCGKDAAKEVGNRRGDYVCEECRVNPEADPYELLKQMLGQAGAGAVDAPKIAGYDIERKLGAGGFGAVYLARRKKDNARVALKVMLSKVAVDEGSRKRFLHEIEISKVLQHENIVTLLDHGAAGSAFFFVMEFCEGGSVDGLIARRGGKLTLAEAKPIMLQALEGLAFAHNKDFVHRDLKPHNIVLAKSDARGAAKVCDFGLAKNFQRAGFTSMTVTGSVAGTPVFMPREQVTNFKYVKPVTDVWSIAATFYNMLTGMVPLDFPKGKDPMQIILSGTAVPIRQRDSAIPSKVAEVIDRALARETKDRYQTAGEMLKALSKVL